MGKQKLRVFGTETLQMPDRTAEITAKELKLIAP
jgi:hypothetical protein